MSDFKFELDKDGVRELLKSEPVQAMLQGKADAAVGKLGEGYSTNSYVGRNRVNVEVTADTYEARKENAVNQTILKAVQGS